MKETFPKDSIFISKDTRTTRWAVPYHHEALNARVENLISRNIDAIKNKTILDLGCHFGTFSYASLLYGAHFVQAIDSEKKLIQEGEQLFEKHRIPHERYAFKCDEVISTMESMREDSYDTILCLGIFYYFNDPVHALSLMKKVVKKHIILDTFTAYYAPCMSKEGDQIFNSTVDETYHLPVVFYPHTQAMKGDYILPVNFISKKKKRISMLALPTITAMEYFFNLLNLKYRRISWKEYVVNNYTWKDFIDYETKKSSHWADIYHTDIRVSYIIEK